MPYTNDTKPGLGTVSISIGNPIGLLLSLTYAEAVATPGEVYTNGTKPSSSYSNDVKP